MYKILCLLVPLALYSADHTCHSSSSSYVFHLPEIAYHTPVIYVGGDLTAQ